MDTREFFDSSGTHTITSPWFVGQRRRYRLGDDHSSNGYFAFSFLLSNLKREDAR